MGLAALLAVVVAASIAAPAGAHVVRAVSSFTPDGVEGPYGIAVDQSTGDVYVTGRSSGNVEEYSATGQHESSFVSPELTFPAGVAVDNSSDASKGDVYVSEYIGETVLELDSTGGEAAGFTPITTGSFPTGDPGSEEFKPYGVAVDPTNGDLVVADRANEKVDIFSSSGVFVSQFAVESVFGVAVGAGGEIFTSTGTGAQEWSPSDGYSTPIPIGPQELELHAAAVDGTTGDLFIDGEGGIAEYDAAGAQLLQFGSGLLEEGSFGLAVDEASDTVYATELGGDLVYAFGAPVALAAASTGTPATDITGTSASVSGSVNPEGTTVTSCRFEYGLSASYGVTVPCSQAPPLTGNAAITERGSLEGLLPDATYRYRLVAVNSGGASYGEDQTLQTTALAPSLDGESVSAVTQTSVTLNARINPNNQATAYQFQYGTSTAYGTAIPIPAASVGAGYGDVNVGQQLTGLSPGTTYHYRVVATNATSPPGGTPGPDEAFTTPPLQPPVVSTGQASGVAQNTATLTATIDTQGFQTTYEFDIGTDTSYGTRIFGAAGSEAGEQAFTASLQGLAPDTTYHYRIVATNTFGTTYGADETFTTSSYPSAALAGPATAPLVPAPLLASTSSSSTATAKAASGESAAHAARHESAGKRQGRAREHRAGSQSHGNRHVRDSDKGRGKR
jgi:hypothetical protein